MLSLALLATLITPGRPNVPVARRDSLHPEPVILEIVVGATASATVYALRSGDTALLPLEKVLALVGLPPAGDTNRFESTDSLSARLGVPVSVDWDELIVTINDDGTLPLTKRTARELRRAEFERTRAASAAQGEVTTLPRQQLPRTVTIDYDMNAATDGHETQPLVRLGFGATLLGGGLDIDLARAPTLRQAALAWRRSWPNPSVLREVHVGALDIENVGAGIGVSMSSQWQDQPAVAEWILLAGLALRGSQVEVYRDGILVYAGVVDSSGQYRIRVPIFRGSNNVKVATFGPRGEESVASRYISINESMIRPGTGTYDLSVARCRNDNCEYAGQFNMRYSPFNRVTFGGGLTELRTQRSHVVDIASVFAIQLRDDLNVEIQPGSRSIQAQVQFAPDSSFELSASYRSMKPTSPLDHLRLTSSRANLSAIWRPSGLSPLTGNVDYSVATGRLGIRVSVGSVLSLGSTYLQPFAVFTSANNSAAGRWSLAGSADAAIPFMVPGSRLHVVFGDRYSGESSLAASFPITRAMRIAAGAIFAAETRAPGITVSLQILNSALRYDAHATRLGPSQLTTHTISGSVTLTTVSSGAGPAIALSSEQSRGRSQIVGTVFIDDNSNGKKDEGELVLPEVSVAVGSTTVETDAAGLYHAYGVVPFLPIVINVDALTLPDTAVHIRAFRVTPLPNQLLRVDIPVPVAGYRSASAGVAGVDRIAQDSKGGDSPSVHRYDFESGATDANPVAHARQSTKSREDVAAEAGPIAFRDVEVMGRARIDK